MFLYNVTIGIDPDIEQEWLNWMKETHIPDVLRTGMFTSHKMYKVLHDNNDGSISYSVQYFANSLENVLQYLEVFAPALVEEHMAKFRNKHVAFRTLLEEV
jgi:hypothetical protein